MLEPPAKNAVPVDTSEGVPAVLVPPTDAAMPPPVTPEINTDPPETPTVTPPAPENPSEPIEAVAVDACVVLPAAYKDCEMPVVAGLEIRKLLLVQPPEMNPPTEMLSWLCAYVLVDDCPAVLPVT